jgi:hypothetical protein
VAGRKTTGFLQGTILYGGHKPSSRMRRRHVGYVEQQDTLVPTLTGAGGGWRLTVGRWLLVAADGFRGSSEGCSGAASSAAAEQSRSSVFLRSRLFLQENQKKQLKRNRP